MKKFISLFVIIFIFAACSKKVVKFELFSPEAFAYSLDEGYELDAKILVKGFHINEADKNFSAKLTYSADIVMPNGTVQKDVNTGVVSKEEKEEFTEMEISIQKTLDKSFKTGKYKVIFNVTDDATKQQLKTEKDFGLSE